MVSNGATTQQGDTALQIFEFFRASQVSLEPTFRLTLQWSVYLGTV